MKGVKQLGFRSGNWLSAEQSSEVLRQACGDSMRAKRDYAMLAMLFGCGFRRSELVGLELDEIQMRQGHWAVVDLIGKGGHIRTVPIPNWVKAALDQWTRGSPCHGGQESFARSPEQEKSGEVASHRTLSGMSSGVVARERDWTHCTPRPAANLREAVPRPAVASLSRFSSCLGTRRSRPRNAISAANRTSGIRSMICFDLRIDAQQQAKGQRVCPGHRASAV